MSFFDFFIELLFGWRNSSGTDFTIKGLSEEEKLERAKDVELFCETCTASCYKEDGDIILVLTSDQGAMWLEYFYIVDIFSGSPWESCTPSLQNHAPQKEGFYMPEHGYSSVSFRLANNSNEVPKKIQLMIMSSNIEINRWIDVMADSPPDNTYS